VGQLSSKYKGKRRPVLEEKRQKGLKPMRFHQHVERVKPFSIINQWSLPTLHFREIDILRFSVMRMKVPDKLINQWEFVILVIGFGLHIRYDLERNLKSKLADY
jgi:hypothetical protein